MPRQDLKRLSARAGAQSSSETSSSEIDRIYGLEPVFEPGRGEEPSTLGEFIQTQCPWCGESVDVAIDTSAGDSSWIEDCQVCCGPMQVALKLDETGAIASLSAHRGH